MTRIFFKVLFIFSLLFTSCVKEKDYFLPDGTIEFIGDVQALRQNLRPNVVSLSFEMPVEPALIPLSGRVHLVLEEGTLLDGNNEVYRGQVDVQVRTAASISEWAGWDFSMITEDGFLDAIGSQKIDFKSSENTHLKINLNNPPIVRWVSSNQRNQVALFKMDKQDGKWKFYSSQVEYNEREFMVDNQPESISAYEFTVEDNGWFTIGIELLKPHGADICLNHSEGFTKRNTTSFVVLKNYNTVVILNDWDTDNPYKNCNSLLRLPLNEDVKVVSIAGISGNRYFFDQKNINLNSSELELEMDPKKSNLNQILQRLND